MTTALSRQGHLHAVPGSEVFVYDLPARQVAHSTCNLDGHINQVLLRDRLKGNEGETMCMWEVETGKTQKGSGDRRPQLTWLYCGETGLLSQNVLVSFEWGQSQLWVNDGSYIHKLYFSTWMQVWGYSTVKHYLFQPTMVPWKRLWLKEEESLHFSKVVIIIWMSIMLDKKIPFFGKEKTV